MKMKFLLCLAVWLNVMIIGFGQGIEKYKIGVNYSMESNEIIHCSQFIDENDYKTCIDNYLSIIEDELITLKSELMPGTCERYSLDNTRQIELVVACDIPWLATSNSKNDFRIYPFQEFAKICKNLDIKWTPLLGYHAFPDLATDLNGNALPHAWLNVTGQLLRTCNPNTAEMIGHDMPFSPFSSLWDDEVIPWINLVIDGLSPYLDDVIEEIIVGNEMVYDHEHGEFLSFDPLTIDEWQGGALNCNSKDDLSFQEFRANNWFLLYKKLLDATKNAISNNGKSTFVTTKLLSGLFHPNQYNNNPDDPHISEKIIKAGILGEAISQEPRIPINSIAIKNLVNNVNVIGTSQYPLNKKEYSSLNIQFPNKKIYVLEFDFPNNPHDENDHSLYIPSPVEVEDLIYEAFGFNKSTNSFDDDFNVRYITYYKYKAESDGETIKPNEIIGLRNAINRMFPNYCGSTIADDIDQEAWYACFVLGGLLENFLEDWKGDFEPTENVSRGEAAKAICLAAINLNIIIDYDLEAPYFPDVPTSHPYFKYIQTLKNKGFINGHGPGPDEGKFTPERDYNRAEMAIMMHKVFVEYVCGPPYVNANSPTFNDVPNGEWYTDYVRSISQKEVVLGCQEDSKPTIVSGYDDGTFGPANLINRAEFAKFLMKSYNFNKHGQCLNAGPNNLAKEGSTNYKVNTNDISDIGTQYEYTASTYGQAPAILLGYNTFEIFDNETTVIASDRNTDNYGNPLDFYWSVRGATLTSENAGHSAIRFTPPQVSQTTVFELYVWVGSQNGKIYEEVVPITVCPSSSISCDPGVNTPPGSTSNNDDGSPDFASSGDHLDFFTSCTDGSHFSSRNYIFQNTSNQTMRIKASLTNYNPGSIFYIDSGNGNTDIYLDPGEDEQFTMRFVPTEEISYEGDLKIRYGDNLENTEIVTIEGGGVYCGPIIDEPYDLHIVNQNLISFRVGFVGDIDANQYFIEIASLPNFADAQGESFYANTVYPKKSLYPENGTGTYYVRAKALNNHHGIETDWSQPLTVNWVNNQPPTIWTDDLLPADESVGINASSVNLQFEGIGGEAPLNYTVWFATSNPAGQAPLVSNTFNTNYTVSNLLPNQKYYWKVCVTDANGNDDCTNIAEFKTAPDATLPTCNNFSVNGGDANTNSQIVSLNINSIDTDVRYMRFSNDSYNWSNWYNYAPLFGGWNLTEFGGVPGTGNKTVYVQLQDYSDNLSTVCYDDIDVAQGSPGYFIVRDKTFSSLRAANEYANAGDVIYATEGYFDLTDEYDQSAYSSPVTGSVGYAMKDGVSLVGAGMGKTTLYWEGVKGLILKNNNSVKGITIMVPDFNFTEYSVIFAGNNSSLEYCEIKDGQIPLEFDWSGPTYTNILIRNCIIWNNSKGIEIGNSNNVDFVNNVVALNGSIPFDIDVPVSNVSVKNNIFYQNPVGGISLEPGVDYTNNTLFQPYEEDHTNTNNNTSVDPQFVNPSSGNFALQSNSPCINTGVNVGFSYTGSAPDRGAMEYNATGTLNIESNVTNADFVLLKPDGSSLSDSYNWTGSNLPMGMYQVLPQNYTGYYTPSLQYICVEAGGNATLTFNYVADNDPPDGCIQINNGNSHTMNTYISINNFIEDDGYGLEGPLSQMQFSNDNVNWSNPEPIAARKTNWNLTFGDTTAITDGLKTIYAKFSDNNGTWSSSITATVNYQSTGKVISMGVGGNIIGAINGAQAGDIVFLETGTHTISNSIVVSSGVRLQGDENTTVTLLGDLDLEGGASIDGIDFEGGGQTIDITNGTGIASISNCSFKNIDNVFISNPNVYVNIENTVFSQIQNSSFEKFVVGLDFKGMRISNCVFDGSNSTQSSQKALDVYLHGSLTEKSTISNCIFTGFSGTNSTAIEFHDNGYNLDLINLSHNNFYNCSDDISVSGGGVGPTNGSPYDLNPSFVSGGYELAASSNLINVGSGKFYYRNYDGSNNTLGKEGGIFYNEIPDLDASVSPTIGNLNTYFTFDASSTSDQESNAANLFYRWDFDGNGVMDTDSQTSAFTQYQYGSIPFGETRCYVFDEHGAVNVQKMNNTVQIILPDAIELATPVDESILATNPSQYTWFANNSILPETYHIQVATDASFSNLLVDEDSINTSNYPFYNSNLQTEFFWRIRGQNEDGFGAWSSVWTYSNIIDLDYIISEETCAVGNDGAIDLTIEGGVSPFTVTWTNGSSSEDLNGLATGIYGIQVVDALGQESNADIIVAQEDSCVTGAAPVADFIADLTTVCAGTPVNFTDLSSNDPNTWSWTFNGGTPAISGQQNPTVTYNTSGTYEVSLTVANGAGSDTKTEIAYILVTDGPLATISSTDVSSCSSSSGTATVNVANGTAPFTYLWSDGQTTQTATGLTTGNYSVTVTDAYGCTSTESVTIGTTTAPPAATLGWEWLIGNSSGLELTSSVTDANGNTFTLGTFRGASSFEGISLTGDTFSDLPYVTKSDVDGNVIWAKEVVSNPSGSTYAGGIDLDAAGNIYITASTNGNLTVGGINLTKATPPSGCSGTSTATWVAKLTPDASSAIWAKIYAPNHVCGSQLAVNAMSLKVDGANFYVSGRFSGVTDFNGISKTSNNATDIDGYILKGSISNGSTDWVKQISTPGSNIRIDDIGVCSDGSPVIMGTFNGNIQPEGQSIVNGNGSDDAFISKYNSNGIYQWTNVLGGSEFNRGYRLHCQNNKIFTTSSCHENCDILGTNVNVGAGNMRTILSCFLESGSLEWSQNVNDGYDSGVRTDIIGDGVDIYLAGVYFGSTTIAGMALNSINATFDNYVASFDESGTGNWALSSGSTGGVDRSKNLGVDNLGGIYLTGYVQQNGIFGNLNTVASSTVYIAKIENGSSSSSSGTPPPVANFSYNDNGLTFTFTNNSTDATDYLWSFGDGTTSTTGSPSHTYLQADDYTVCLTASNECGSDTYCTIVSIDPCASSSLSISTTPIPTSCGANNGMGMVVAQGGNPPYTYQWDTNAGSQTNDTAIGLAPGTYTVDVIDDTGCTASSTITISDGNIGVPPSKLWDRSIGGTNNDFLFDILILDNDNYLLSGYSASSPGGDKTAPQIGGNDYWIAMTDTSGNVMWDQTFGGNSSDILNETQKTSDGGYVLGGYSASGISGDKTEASRGSSDYWIVKLNASGNLEWEKTIGSDKPDNLKSIIQTSDGGYLIGGFTASTTIAGDKSQAGFGGYDYWVVKLDSNGNKEWDKTFGGTGTEKLSDVVELSNGTYLIGGYSSSNPSGNKFAARIGSYDYWLVNIDADGNTIWDETFGGTSIDFLKEIAIDVDGNILLAGLSRSGANGNKSEASKGSYDYWLVKIDGNANIIWDKTIGSTTTDYLEELELTTDGGYLLGGYSFGGVGADKTEPSLGGKDMWVVKLNANQGVEWDKTIGTSDNGDYLHGLTAVSNNEYLLGGRTYTTTDGDKTEPSHGGYDMWLIKLRDGNTGDNDLDQICDDVDNCINQFNPDQIDVDGDGIGDICQVSPKTEEPILAEELTKQNSNIKMQLFPNPTSTEINISLEAIDKMEQGGKIQIFSITGQLLYEKTIDKLESGSFDIKISSKEMNFIKGMHLVTFTLESGVVISEKLIIE